MRVAENQPQTDNQTVRPPGDQPSNLRGLVEVELWPGEQLLWVGRPIPRVYAFSRGELVKKATFLSSITLALFAYWMLCSSPELAGARFEFVIAAFLCVFAIIMSVGFAWFYQDAKSIVYAITNNRALIFFLVSPVQLDTAPLHPWDVRAGSDGIGNLSFGMITFYAIPHVNEVAALLPPKRRR